MSNVLDSMSSISSIETKSSILRIFSLNFFIFNRSSRVDGSLKFSRVSFFVHLHILKMTIIINKLTTDNKKGSRSNALTFIIV